MELDSTEQVHGVDDHELRGALDGFSSLLPSSIQDCDKFAIEVRSILEDRAQQGWVGECEADVAVFLHTPYPKKTGDKLSGVPVSNLLASSRPVLGKLFILNRDASWGRVVDLPTDADGVIDWLIASELGDHPVIFAYRSSRRLLARAKGAKFEITAKEIIRDKPPLATLEEVGEALNLFHRENLLSPSVCPAGVWEQHRAADYIPGVRPEKAIQVVLRTALFSWFRGIVHAKIEDPTPVGRIDVRLLQKSDGAWAYWVILELKVLRSSHNAKKGKAAKPVNVAANAEEVAEGVRQVDSFARHWEAIPLLEIFDLRKDKRQDILAHDIVTTELAKHLPAPPACRVWPLFGSAKDARFVGY
jgi:hypothetical protein